MKRHKHMLDLLRPGITFSDEVEFILRKKELTIEDLDLIIENAEKVMLAAVAAKRIKQTTK